MSLTVESCVMIDVSHFMRARLRRDKDPCVDFWQWTDSRGKARSLFYELDLTSMMAPNVRYRYDRNVRLTSFETFEKLMECEIKLHSTKPHYGGLRWWFIEQFACCEGRAASSPQGRRQ
jgi:hypothetical protein